MLKENLPLVWQVLFLRLEGCKALFLTCKGASFPFSYKKLSPDHFKIQEQPPPQLEQLLDEQLLLEQLWFEPSFES